ncbi:MAG TPA: M23 family metallopeptidase [Candidatus Acidoferrales bacterium]|nr:M23 family metallopeptidase [Candidatus Acidoferrales bacterium]
MTGKNLGRAIFWPAFLAVAAGCVAASYHVRFSAEGKISEQASLAAAEAKRIQRQVVLFSKMVVPSRLPFAQFLQKVGIDAATATRVVASALPVFDFRHMRAGNQLKIGRSVLGELREVDYRIDEDHILSIAPGERSGSSSAASGAGAAGSASGSPFESKIETIPSTTEEAGVAGKIDGSLFEAVTAAGEKPELAMRIAGIFAYDLDFYTDPRPGDTFRVVIEKKILANGETASYGRILAAEYDNGERAYRAVLFHDPYGDPAYYTPDGKSMKRAFLHSPLKFAAPITSHFSYSRFHPILKQYRPHLGIDYGAPMGTPVQTIADGKVIFAARKGEDGNLVKVQHSNGYTTYYMHLSRILVRDGQHVQQGQNIGLVGMTGLATGPHLDFRIEEHGTFLNFEKLKLPSSDPIAKKDWNAFAAARDHALAEMPAIKAGNTAVAENQPAQTIPGASPAR